MIEIFTKEFYEKIDLGERDILLRLKQIVIVKMEIFNQYPEIFNYMMSALKEDAKEVKKDLEQRNKDIFASNYQKIFENIDSSKFKEDIDIQRAINIIIWTLEGLSTQNQEKIRAGMIEHPYDEALNDFELYISLLKQSFYQ